MSGSRGRAVLSARKAEAMALVGECQRACAAAQDRWRPLEHLTPASIGVSSSRSIGGCDGGNDKQRQCHRLVLARHELMALLTAVQQQRRHVHQTQPQQQQSQHQRQLVAA